MEAIFRRFWPENPITLSHNMSSVHIFKRRNEEILTSQLIFRPTK